MSWYRDNDGKIITDEEFQSDCMECSCFCQEGTINIPCNGERTDCPYFKEVDTSEYDKEIRNKAIDDFASELENHSIYADIGRGDEVKMEWVSPVTRIKEIAEQLKGGAE